MLRYFFPIFFVLVVAVVSVLGFRSDNILGLGRRSPEPPLQIFPDMKNQPKIQPQHPSAFFADGRGARAPIPGTVPIGYNLPHNYYQTGASNRDVNSGFSNFPDYLNTGKMGDVYGDGLPVDADESLLLRGQERFNINCAICHGALAAGDGIIKGFGLVTIASLQDERIRTMPDGQIFSTITNGKNTMGAYGPNVAVEDRWAIIAYLRVLQKSQNAKLAELPPEQQQQLNSKQ